jgi:hypothetical protein
MWARGRVERIFCQTWKGDGASPTSVFVCLLIDWGHYVEVDDPEETLRILPDPICAPGLASLYALEGESTKIFI